MQNLPESGKNYTSKTDPTCKIHVEHVGIIEADEESPETFWVEGCEAKDANRPGAPGIEFTGEEWLEHDFIPA